LIAEEALATFTDKHRCCGLHIVCWLTIGDWFENFEQRITFSEINRKHLNPMKDDYIEYRTHYIKGDGVYYALFISGLLSVFSISTILLIKNVWFTLIFIWPTLSLPFVILIFKSRKVRIGEDYIESASLFGKKKMFIKDVNKFGVFVSGSYTWPKVTSQTSINDIDDEELFFHQIYLTENTEFDLDCFRTMKHLNFRYRRKIYFRIKEMIEKENSKRQFI
jgi:hypothetical protein